VRHLTYLAVLAFIVAATWWLEIGLRTRVLRRWRRLVVAVLPVTALFVVWDGYAIGHGQWSFDPAQVTGWRVLGQVPVEEVLFFVVVPVASVLTFEAVRSVWGWPVADAPEGSRRNT